MLVISEDEKKFPVKCQIRYANWKIFGIILSIRANIFISKSLSKCEITSGAWLKFIPQANEAYQTENLLN